MCLETRVRQLEQAYSKIERERMQGLPFLNKDLRVEAIGFTCWQDYYLGVLLTPWFMNMMLLPAKVEGYAYPSIGGKLTHVFPSGQYEFTAGEEPGVGPYQMCSLFSPVLQFTDHGAAVATAQAVMQGLMDEANRDETSTRAKEIERIWRGEPRSKEAGESESSISLSERIAKPMSRRALLKGEFLRDA